ncbi:MAG: DUF4430 domain-containing protein [Candidatus Nealsonbacteria bacterium]|nr:DUF4430 domain-containing protein [Candidatus Nealsonbacteria bacterium]
MATINFKKIIIFTTVLIGILLIISVAFIFYLKVPFFQEQEKKLPEQNQEIIEEKLLLAINYGGENTEADFKEGMTVFDLLKNGSEKLNLALKIKNYDMGIFIEAIGGKENGEDGRYWMYYVNGEMPMVSADKYQLKPADKVEFKFEKSKF